MLQLLLVDDESYVVDDLEIAFPWKQFGIEKVHKAYSGLEALHIINHSYIDIIITDIAMPGMNGLELIDQVKKINKNIKCILLTGYAEFEYAKEAINQGVVEYLVKPLNHNNLWLCLNKTISLMKKELELIASYEQAISMFNEQLPVMKDKLLNELLQGKSYSKETLDNKLVSYSLNPYKDNTAFLILIRLEEHFTRYGLNSLMLFEYAVTNIANELLVDTFHTWHCRDSNDFLVFTLTAKQQLDKEFDTKWLLKELTHRSLQLHRNVNEYLGGGISVILSSPGNLHTDIRNMYERAVSAIRKQVGKGTGYFLDLKEQPEASHIRLMNILYDPPTFNHLMETGQWNGFLERLHQVEIAFDMLPEQTDEHLEAIKTVLMSSFFYIAHRNNILISDTAGSSLFQGTSFRSFSQILEWALRISSILQEMLENDVSNQQQSIIREIQMFISSNLSTISLQSVADHISLHPAYVSKLFKQLWGSSISEYILSIKMENAIAWLRNTNDKVYEISDMLGYSNSQYFIKVFKEQYGMTPQDYREKM